MQTAYCNYVVLIMGVAINTIDMVANGVVWVKNVERLISRCEDVLGDKTKIRGQQWRIVKVSTIYKLIWNVCGLS